MEHFGGLDVSVKETSICIVDDTGKIVKEVKERANLALLKVLGTRTLRNFGLKVGMVGKVRFRPASRSLSRIPRLGGTGGAAAHRPAGAP